MSKNIYTVQFKLTCDPTFFNDWKAAISKHPHVKDLQLLNTEPVIAAVQYPSGGARNLKLVYLTFDKKVSKDQVEQIVEYWNKSGYVRGAGELNWNNGNASFNFDVKQSHSHDINARNILDELFKLLEEGTPVRSQSPYGQAVKGLGKGVVRRILGQ